MFQVLWSSPLPQMLMLSTLPPPPCEVGVGVINADMVNPLLYTLESPHPPLWVAGVGIGCPRRLCRHCKIMLYTTWAALCTVGISYGWSRLRLPQKLESLRAGACRITTSRRIWPRCCSSYGVSCGCHKGLKA